MLTKVQQAKAQWGGFDSTIDTWLEERKQLLVQYCKLASLPPFEREDKSLPEKNEIVQFCEILMDYVSAGHFEIYQKILGDADDTDTVENILNQLDNNTDKALLFNDKYASINDEDGLDGLASFDLRLAELGQHMEERFSYEDQLIKTIADKKPS